MIKLLNSRRFRQGAVATAITVVVIALVVVLNMLASALSQRYSLSLDLTENKIFGLSAETKDFLTQLDKDVEVFFLSTEEQFTARGEYFVQANEVVKKYSVNSPRIKISYIDLVRNPGFASRFPNLQLNTSAILVTCGDKTAELTPYDLYNVQSDYMGNEMITSSKAEQAMTSALLRVTSDDSVVVSMLIGHGESYMGGFRSLLELNNYTVIEQNLLTEDIDPNAKIAVMAGPMRDLSEDELKKLDKFLSNDSSSGKTLFYMVNDVQPRLDNFSAFLADWGISVGDGLVFELSANRLFYMNYYMPVVDYYEDVYAKPLLERGMYTLIPYSRPVSALFETNGARKTFAPLMFSQTSGVSPADPTSEWTPSQSDISGPLPALLISSETAYEGSSPVVSNVVVSPSILALEDDILAATSIGNSEYFLSLMNNLSERDDVISIQAKTIGGNELGILSGQAGMLAFLLVVLLPLTVLVTGVVIWLRRRHL